jgi:hypothetical protein
VVRRVEGAAAEAAAAAVAARRGAAAAHQEGADGDGRGRRVLRRPGPAAAGHAAAAQLPLRRHSHAPGRRLIETRVCGLRARQACIV